MLDSNSTPSPIFIIGSPRSGTSVLTWCLGQHSNIKVLPETNWLASMGKNIPLAYLEGTQRGGRTQLSAHGISEGQFFENLGQAFDKIIDDGFENTVAPFREKPAIPKKDFTQIRSKDDPKRRWVDGTPLNTTVLWALHLFFPNAKFINLYRHPDQVIRSLNNFERAGGKPQSPRQAVKTWIRDAGEAFRFEKALGTTKVKRLSYDSLIENPEQSLNECLEFVGEEFEDHCTAPLNKKINSSKSASDDVDPTKELSGSHDYQEALKLFDLLNTHETPEHGEYDALTEIKKCYEYVPEMESENDPYSIGGRKILELIERYLQSDVARFAILRRLMYWLLWPIFRLVTLTR